MTGHDGWYIAEPTGETTGPMTRAELTAQYQSGRHSAAALCWHVDVAEWHSLARVAGGGRGTAETAPAPQRPAAQATDRAESRTDPQAVAVQYAASEPARADAGDGKRKQQDQRAERKRMKREAMAKLAGRLPDDGKRLLSSAAAGAGGTAAAAVAARAGGAVASAEAKAKTGTEYVPIALRRLAARALDTAWLGIPAAALLWGVANRFFANMDTTVTYREPVFLALVLLAPLALLPLEAIAVGLFGRTPGKALLALEVQRRGGGRPGLLLGVRRAREVFVRGLGLGIPLVNLITIVASGARLINQGATSWDDKLGLATRTEALDAKRTQIALGVLVGSWFLLGTDQFAGLLNRLAAESWRWLAP